MRVIFHIQGVTVIVKEGVRELGTNHNEGQKAAYHDANKKDGKAMFIIHQSVDAYIFQKIVSANTTMEHGTFLLNPMGVLTNEGNMSFYR